MFGEEKGNKEIQFEDEYFVGGTVDPRVFIMCVIIKSSSRAYHLSFRAHDCDRLVRRIEHC